MKKQFFLAFNSMGGIKKLIELNKGKIRIGYRFPCFVMEMFNKKSEVTLCIFNETPN